MKHARFRAATAAIFLLTGLAACGDKPEEAAFSEEPKGYVEFYLPAARPGEEDIGIDVQVYRIENGRRVFLGMTQKWKGLAEPKRGLTVAAKPGEQDFVVVYDTIAAPVRLRVEEGGYHKVRIAMTGVSAEQIIGATRQMRFGLQAEVEPPK